MNISNAFETFQREAPQASEAWQQFVISHGKTSALDEKTQALAYLSVLSAVHLESGIPFHVKMAKMHGATREEVTSAVLVGLPAVGNIVTTVLPIAVTAYDED